MVDSYEENNYKRVYKNSATKFNFAKITLKLIIDARVFNAINYFECISMITFMHLCFVINI